MQKDSLFKWKPKSSKISVLTSDKIDLKYKKKNYGRRARTPYNNKGINLPWRRNNSEPVWLRLVTDFHFLEGMEAKFLIPSWKSKC
jgi:hypothetical protein